MTMDLLIQQKNGNKVKPEERYQRHLRLCHNERMRFAMLPMPLPPVDLIRQLFDYDPDTGVLTWKSRDLLSFASAGAGKCWNAVNSGKPAGADNCGYLRVMVSGRRHMAHRLIWAIMTGRPPVDQVDHIDGNRSNNKWENLREVSNSENLKNSKIPIGNTSGNIGVSPFSGKWKSHIGVSGKKIHLGTFKNIEDAIKAREEAELIYGFHKNHGRRL